MAFGKTREGEREVAASKVVGKLPDSHLSAITATKAVAICEQKLCDHTQKLEFEMEKAEMSKREKAISYIEYILDEVKPREDDIGGLESKNICARLVKALERMDIKIEQMVKSGAIENVVVLIIKVEPIIIEIQIGTAFIYKLELRALVLALAKLKDRMRQQLDKGK